MPFAFIGVGSNIDPEKNIIKAAGMLEMSADIVAVSGHYRTAPLGGREQDDYINAVWKIYTNLGSADLKKQLRDIESRLGRSRSGDKYAAREIDLDILLFDNNDPDPDIMNRDFLYGPLLELEPDIVLPGGEKPLKELVAPASLCLEAALSDFMKKEYPDGPEKS